MSKYIGGLYKPPKQTIRGITTGQKISNQALAAARLKQERDNDFLWMVVDDVSLAIKKIVPSLDPEQGGLPPTDLSAPAIVDRVMHEFTKVTFRQTINALMKKRYVIGSRMVSEKRINLHRSPTRFDIRNAVRIAVEQLQYSRREVIEEDSGQGIQMGRNVAAANAIAALREQSEARAKRLKRKKPIQPLEPVTTRPVRVPRTR